MPDTTIEQENLTEGDVISLLNDESSTGAPARKGYEDYVKQAEDEAKASEETADADPVTKDKVKVVEIPEKFKGKTAAEIAASYMELQSEYGRRNTEVGSLRKLTDQLLELKQDTTEQEAPADKEVDVDSLLNNPGETINSAVDSSPRLKALEEKLVSADRAADLKEFNTSHPDWETVMNTPEFASWITESPMRQRLFAEAHTKYDYATGGELLDMYALAKGDAVKTATDERNTKARKSAKAAVTESGGTTEGKGKPRFKRTELIDLKLNSPRKYESMKKEIMEAYADKRVI